MRIADMVAVSGSLIRRQSMCFSAAFNIQLFCLFASSKLVNNIIFISLKSIVFSGLHLYLTGGSCVLKSIQVTKSTSVTVPNTVYTRVMALGL